jgi:hypothetical protein
MIHIDDVEAVKNMLLALIQDFNWEALARLKNG